MEDDSRPAGNRAQGPVLAEMAVVECRYIVEPTLEWTNNMFAALAELKPFESKVRETHNSELASSRGEHK